MYSLFYSHETNTLDSLAFQNIEALAQSENDAGAIATVSVQSIAEAQSKYKVSGLSLE